MSYGLSIQFNLFCDEASCGEETVEDYLYEMDDDVDEAWDEFFAASTDWVRDGDDVYCKEHGKAYV